VAGLRGRRAAVPGRQRPRGHSHGRGPRAWSRFR
jgi:hypothetical protein